MSNTYQSRIQSLNGELSSPVLTTIEPLDTLGCWALTCCCCSVAQLCPTFCDLMDSSTPGFPILHHLPELGQSHVHWVSDTIQPSDPIVPFSLCLQSFPVSGSFRRSRRFTSGGQSIGASGGQSIGASASASVLPMNIQDWFPLELTDFISLQSKGLFRVFSNTTIQKHQFLGAQPSLWSNSNTHIWLRQKPP